MNTTKDPTSTNITIFRSRRFILLNLFMALAWVPVILLGIITNWQAMATIARNR